MSTLQDYYRTLQVHPQAESDVIEAAYKKLAKKYHPDISKLDVSLSQEQMQLINQAYEVLRDVEKRAKYHSLWQQTFAKVSTESNQKARQNPQQTLYTIEAMRVIKSYFEYLQSRHYQKAYSLLTKMDRQRISLSMFMRWQLAVSQIFALQNFSVQPGINNFDESDRSVKNQLIRFVVMTVDYNAIMDRLEHDAFEKKVQREGKVWAMVLGVSDVSRIIEHYEELTQLIQTKSMMKTFVDSYSKQDGATGLLNKKGFLDELERESMRFLRYNRRFCLVMIGIVVKKTYSPDLLEDITRRMADLLKNRLRKLDSIGRWRDQTFTILMPETDLRGGILATQKIKRYMEVEFSTNKNTELFFFPASVDVYTGDLPMAIDRLDYLFDVSKKHKRYAIQSMRGSL